MKVKTGKEAAGGKREAKQENETNTGEVHRKRGKRDRRKRNVE